MSQKINTTILAVDDEESILQVYEDVLGNNQSQTDLILARRKARSQHAKQSLNINYDIHLAQSGEKAVEIVKEQMELGNQIAAGFFDMKMPGGIDGLETIRRIKKLDPEMLVAVVTAYTDRTVEQIGGIFDSQDEWMYFNKPFTRGELKQTALHLTIAWERRKEIRQSKRAIKKFLAVMAKSRTQAEELLQILPTETHFSVLKKWLEH
jgi:CheY-like chemotaxis protein